MGVNVAASLRRLGVDVYDRIDMPDAEIPKNIVQQKLEEEGAARYKQGNTNVVCWQSVPTHARGWWQGQHVVCSTMWEATVLPPSFRENLHEFDQIIVPSEQNRELFGRYHDDVSVVPLGVDPDVWHYQERRAPDNEFRFLIGGSGPRKGTDVAYKAFRAAFPPTVRLAGPQPTITFKSPNLEDYYGRHVTRIGGHLSAEDEVALYASAHCYLQPSRGEGFGLQPLQAMAQGCPTILTNAHGHAAFAPLAMPLDSKMEKAGFFIYGDAGDWWEPDLDQLVDYMRWTYANYDEACARATVASERVLAEFTWENTANAFIAAIGEDRLSADYQGDGSWYTPTSKRYLVMVTRPWQADIAGATYLFEPGVEYWETADVKRILWEGGLLDVACLAGDDTGLAQSQVDLIPEYTASHSYCPHCSQKLGTGITRSDEIMANFDAELEAMAG